MLSGQGRSTLMEPFVKMTEQSPKMLGREGLCNSRF